MSGDSVSSAEVLDTPGSVLLLAPTPADPSACTTWLTGQARDLDGSVAVATDHGQPAPPHPTADRRPSVTRIDVAREDGLVAGGLTLLDQLVDTGEDTNAVCVDGVTSVVREQGTETAFRVLIALQTVTRHRPWRVHIHLNPDPVDARTRRTLAQAADAVVRYDEEDRLVIVRDRLA